MGNYQLALPDALTIVHERPGWIEGIILCGNVQGELGLWSEAAAHWHEALLLQPHNPILRQSLERATVEMGEDEASKYRELIETRQTGDAPGIGRSGMDGGGYAVEVESYREGGREYFRPKGTGERLEREQRGVRERARVAEEEEEAARRAKLTARKQAEAEEEAVLKAAAQEAEEAVAEAAAAAAAEAAEAAEQAGKEAADGERKEADKEEGEGEEVEGKEDDAAADISDPLAALAAAAHAGSGR